MMDATYKQRRYIAALLASREVSPERKQQILYSLENERPKLTTGEAGRIINELEHLPKRSKMSNSKPTGQAKDLGMLLVISTAIIAGAAFLMRIFGAKS
jgi:hypothetical protein